MNVSIAGVPLAARRSITEIIGELNKNDPSPLYLQLQLRLRAAIHSGDLSVDEALPPERNLAEDLAVSRITVRKAFDRLVEQGFIARRRGAGTFVTRPFEKNFSKLNSFTEEMLARGRIPRSEWLGKTTGSVSPEESLSLGLSPGSDVCRFVRLRYADESLMALEYTTIPTFCLPPLAQITSSLYSALQLTGHRPVRALQRLRAVSLVGEHAEKLRVNDGTAGLLIERRGFLTDGRACEFSHSYYRGDAYDVVAELSQHSG